MSAHESTAEEVSRLSLEGPICCVHSPVDSELLLWKVKSSVELFRKTEYLRLQASLAWQAQAEFVKHLESNSASAQDLRRSGLRMTAAFQGLKEALDERLGTSSD